MTGLTSQLRHLLPHGPYIHTGAQGRCTGTGRRYEVDDCYALWAVESGILELNSERLVGPAAVVIWPGTDTVVEVPVGSDWRHLRFDVVYEERKALGGLASCHREFDRLQPPPTAIWGIDPDCLIPAALVPGCLAMLKQVGATWWRSELDLLRANHRLGTWLLDWVAHHARRGDTGTGSRWLDEVHAMMEEQLTAGVTVAELAAQRRMGPGSFTRRYREETGHPPGQELRRRRLARACHLLRTTDFDLSQVAIRSGFRSPASFSHRFKAVMGEAPSRWRRRQV